VRDRVKQFFAEYGAAGVVVYLVIHVSVFLGLWAAIEAGWRPVGAAANAGAVVSAYAITSLTKVPRFAVTVLVTPFVVRLWERVTGRRRRRRPAAGPAAAARAAGARSGAEQPAHLAGERPVGGDGAPA
jgi:hypothetical protein